ncbi:MAG: ABC transporter permease [Alphaproteobacteria bacterium]|nr:ABC transporter permease [Alphaproteobacteria bacterium]
MTAFLLRRLMQSLAVMLMVGLVAFALFNFTGDPVNNMVGAETSAAEREKLRDSLGLNDPAVMQFGHFVGRVLQGNFGFSYQHRRPVAELIVERLPATLELSLGAALLALGIGIPMGVFTAIKRESWLSRLFMTVSLVGISLPTLLIGILMILVFAVILGWLPAFGRGQTVRLGWWTSGLLTVDGLRSVLLPAFTLGLFQMTLIMRLVRSEMLEVLRTDFIKFARARGLTNRAVHFGHALKNTLVPVITITGLQIGSIVAFAIITETVFQWPGMGLLFIQAVAFGDIPVMATYLVLVSLFFVTINLVVDLAYYAVDPRLRADKDVVSGFAS